MKKEQVYGYIPFGGYTEGYNIVIPGNYIPLETATILAHEGGHVLDNDKKFQQKIILTPQYLARINIGISEARRRWLQDLLAQPSVNDLSWQRELTEFIWRALSIITKGKFDPGSINLTILQREEDFKQNAKTKKMSGVSYEGNNAFVVLTRDSYQAEVPAYYTEEAVLTLIDKIITPNKTPRIAPTPPLPSHLLAYESVERWFRLGLFPTPRRVRLAWEQNLQAA